MHAPRRPRPRVSRRSPPHLLAGHGFWIMPDDCSPVSRACLRTCLWHRRWWRCTRVAVVTWDAAGPQAGGGQRACSRRVGQGAHGSSRAPGCRVCLGGCGGTYLCICTTASVCVSLSVLCGMGVHSHGSARLCREQSQACVLKRSLSVFYRC